MQSKKDKWLDIFNSDECKKCINLLERVSFLFKKYSGAEIDKTGTYFISGGLFNSILNSRKSHIQAVINALNQAGYKKELHFELIIDHGSALIGTLISRLKNEIGDKEMVKGGDLEALLGVVYSEAGVGYDYEPKFEAPTFNANVQVEKERRPTFTPVQINPEDKLRAKLNEQINTFIKEINNEIKDISISISDPPPIYAQIKHALNLLPELDKNKLVELENTVKYINQLGEKTHPSLDHLLGTSILTHVQKITTTIEALRQIAKAKTEQNLEDEEELSSNNGLMKNQS